MGVAAGDAPKLNPEAGWVEKPELVGAAVAGWPNGVGAGGAGAPNENGLEVAVGVETGVPNPNAPTDGAGCVDCVELDAPKPNALFVEVAC